MPLTLRLYRDRTDAWSRPDAGRSERRKKWPLPPTRRLRHPRPPSAAPPNLWPASPKVLRQSALPPRRARWHSQDGAGSRLNGLGSSYCGLLGVIGARLILAAPIVMHLLVMGSVRTLR